MKKSTTRVAFVSLGCAKNIVDSEKMLGQLAEAGCVICAEDDADVLIVNTCGFLSAARDEADDVVSEALERKRAGELKRVVVAGCLVQRDGTDILQRLPGVDAIVGVHNRDDIVRAVMGRNEIPIEKAARSRPVELYLSDYHQYTQIDTARLRITPEHYAYLRISEGCNQKCTFCTIPSIRGRMHAKPPQVIVNEARELISDGVKELHLIGQDTTSYGIGDDCYEGGLANLLRMLNDVDGAEWVRLMYAYPTVLTDEIIDAIAECPRVCNYIDIPLQHINNHVLKAMHRRVTREETEQLLAKLRERIPDVTIRTTMIVGFPGETEAEFEELVEFVRDFKFNMLGAFPYSLEPDTPAGRMKDQLPASLKEERMNALMAAQQEIAFELAENRIGRTERVLVDESVGSDTVLARHEGQAPTVDSVTIVESTSANPGEFIDVKITGRRDYDLLAKPARVSLPVLSKN